MKRRNERGAALIWAVATMTLVLLAISLVAGALANQANSVRRLKTEAAREDLERAGRAWAGERLRRGGIDAAESLELAGGTLTLRPSAGWGAELVIEVRGERPSPALRLGRSSR